MPADISPLTGRASNSMIAIVQLRDEKGDVVASGTENVMPRPPNNTPLAAGQPFEVAYSIIYPGRGTLYAWCVEQYDAELVKLIQLVRVEKKPWKGRLAARNTIGPRPDKKCNIDHGTGDFAGLRGTFYKVHIITAGDPAQREISGLQGETKFYIEFSDERGSAP